MAKKDGQQEDAAGKGGRGGKKGPTQVRRTSGRHHPFLRGMVAHGLVQRGLGFDDAYAAAQAIRDRLAGREEITTAELEGLIQEQLVEMVGAERAARLVVPVRPEAGVDVVYPGEAPQPFSRGLLARSIQAAGIDLDRAYELVGRLLEDLRAEGLGELARDELAQRVGEILDHEVGQTAAAQYRIVRSLQNLPRPLILYLAGASGTGKSTLGLELAPLLRIYRINATDTIRQVMRMVFSPAILPAIHRSSFESSHAPTRLFTEEARIPVPEAEPLGALAGEFEEQVTRVCVGIRAVVERAIMENMSIIVEGVHLVPPLVPFPDLEGAAYQVMLVLSTLDEEVHRRRFLARAKGAGRRGERYLEHFDEIRAIQDFSLQQAEAYDVPILDTSDGEEIQAKAMRILTGVLQQRIPQLVEPTILPEMQAVPCLLLVLDGAPDRALRALGDRTPLEAANLPHLDRLAMEGACGLADPVAPDVVPDTASGSLAIFGQSPQAMKRGAVEALGTELEPRLGDVALRGNLATLDENGRVLDRRAGRIREGAADLVAGLDRMEISVEGLDGIEVRVGISTEHRLAVVLRGEGLSPAIQGSDPGDGAPPGPPLDPRPLDPEDEAAAKTALALERFELAARKVLARHSVNRRRVAGGLAPANAILTRGAGRVHELPPLERGGRPVRMWCISGDRTLLGMADWLGGRTVTSASMTANLDTDLAEKFDRALKALKKGELVVLHVKGADIAAHDRRVADKVAFLEAVDRELGGFLERWTGELRIAVASDHATLSELGQHSADPVPVVLWGAGIEADPVEAFDERSVGAGSLQRFPLRLLLPRLLDRP